MDIAGDALARQPSNDVVVSNVFVVFVVSEPVCDDPEQQLRCCFVQLPDIVVQVEV